MLTLGVTLARLGGFEAVFFHEVVYHCGGEVARGEPEVISESESPHGPAAAARGEQSRQA